jgi:hypothetical protein
MPAKRLLTNAQIAGGSDFPAARRPAMAVLSRWRGAATVTAHDFHL